MAIQSPMRIKRNSLHQRKLAAVGWFCILLVAVHFLVCLLPEICMQDFWDPQYALKLKGLRSMLSRNPDRPLWLIMGSSRIEHGLRPDVLADRMYGQGQPVVYNFGMGGADLFRQLICLRRIVESGIRPQRIGIEIVGAQMGRDESQFISERTFISRARRGELGDYRSYSLDPRRVGVYWWRSRLDPFFQYGPTMTHRSILWRPLAKLMENREVQYDPWGWYPVKPAPIPKKEYLDGLAYAKTEYQNDLVADFKVSANADRACRQILDYCRAQKLNVFLLRTPEGKDFQAFYPAQANAAIDAWIARIETDSGVKFIDARSWIATEGFSDGHHLNATGAVEFTRRLAEELFGR